MLLRWPFVLRSTSALWQHRAQVAEKHLARLDRRFGEISALATTQQRELEKARADYVELTVAVSKRGNPRD